MAYRKVRRFGRKGKRTIRGGKTRHRYYAQRGGVRI